MSPDYFRFVLRFHFFKAFKDEFWEEVERPLPGNSGLMEDPIKQLLNC